MILPGQHSTTLFYGKVTQITSGLVVRKDKGMTPKIVKVEFLLISSNMSTIKGVNHIQPEVGLQCRLKAV